MNKNINNSEIAQNFLTKSFENSIIMLTTSATLSKSFQDFIKNSVQILNDSNSQFYLPYSQLKQIEYYSQTTLKVERNAAAKKALQIVNILIRERLIKIVGNKYDDTNPDLQLLSLINTMSRQTNLLIITQSKTIYTELIKSDFKIRVHRINNYGYLSRFYTAEEQADYKLKKELGL